MRKRLQKKLHSCAMCKPFKMAKCNRWKIGELASLKESERMCLDAVRKPMVEVESENV